jgi:hypothetical protein
MLAQGPSPPAPQHPERWPRSFMHITPLRLREGWSRERAVYSPLFGTWQDHGRLIDGRRPFIHAIRLRWIVALQVPRPAQGHCSGTPSPCASKDAAWASNSALLESRLSQRLHLRFCATHPQATPRSHAPGSGVCTARSERPTRCTATLVLGARSPDPSLPPSLPPPTHPVLT